MEYFEILNLKQEPFSNSPDPDFFFQSRQHMDCLQKLEIAIRLKRGLNVVVGEVGTGKTTLCRQLIRRLALDKEIETHLLLDPGFPSPADFLQALAGMFGNSPAGPSEGEQNVKEEIKQYLYRKGVDEKKIIILIIDEGQKITGDCLELLRELLNYETNEHKLLQIVVFAQQEFEQAARKHANFTDRINLYFRLGPLKYQDTRRLIEFRLAQAGHATSTHRFFTQPAVWALYRSTKGYPRKVINLCHACILAMIIQNRSQVGWFLVRACTGRIFPPSSQKVRSLSFAMVGVLFLSAALLFINAQWRASLFPPQAQTMAVENRDWQPPGPATTTESLSAEAKAESGIMLKADGPPRELPIDEEAKPPGFPPLMGQLAMHQGGSLSKMIQQVYGEFNPGYLEAVLKVNPLVRRLEAIETGRLINFPAIPARERLVDLKCSWIQLDEKEDLAQAVSCLRKYREQGLLVRLMPLFHPRSGFKFVIILREYLLDEAAVKNRLAGLPQEIMKTAKKIQAWGDGQTILFADPYLM